MRYVLDLDGDWFATEPVYPPCTHRGPCDLPGVCSGTPDPVCPVAVGDVLANVRTIEYGGNLPALAWANPPFLRVVEVLPMVDGNPDDWPDRHVVVSEPYDEPTLLRRTASRQWVGGETVTCWLLGGWAVRVESSNSCEAHEVDTFIELWRRSPHFDGPPLNKEAQQ